LQQWTLLFKVVIVLHRLAVEGTMDADTLAVRRDHFLGCLYDLSVEPTNNRAER